MKPQRIGIAADHSGYELKEHLAGRLRESGHEVIDFSDARPKEDNDYRPEELFDEQGRLKPELADLAPKGERRMGANPHANGGLLLRDLIMPDFRNYAVDVPSPGAVEASDAHDLDRFHLVMDTIDRLPQTGEKGRVLKLRMQTKLIEHKQYIDTNGQDPPEIRNWKWSNTQ